MPNAVSGAHVASLNTGALSTTHLRQLLIALIALTIALAMVAIEAPVAVEARASGKSDAQRLVKYAKSHLGKRFRIGSEGPRYFDCSGLVYRVYKQAGLIRKIGGGRMLAASYYRWFRRRGLVSRSKPQVGDLIWWTKRGRIAHMGLYIGGGRAISALVNPWGVKKHTVRGIRVKFLGYGHVRLGS